MSGAERFTTLHSSNATSQDSGFSGFLGATQGGWWILSRLNIGNSLRVNNHLEDIGSWVLWVSGHFGSLIKPMTARKKMHLSIYMNDMCNIWICTHKIFLHTSSGHSECPSRITSFIWFLLEGKTGAKNQKLKSMFKKRWKYKKEVKS